MLSLRCPKNFEQSPSRGSTVFSVPHVVIFSAVSSRLELDAMILAAIFMADPKIAERHHLLADCDVLVGEPDFKGADLEKAKLIFASDRLELHHRGLVAGEDQSMGFVDLNNFRTEPFLQLLSRALDLLHYVFATAILIAVLVDGTTAISLVEARCGDDLAADLGAKGSRDEGKCKLAAGGVSGMRLSGAGIGDVQQAD